MYPTVTLRDVQELATVLEFCQHNRPVRWLTDSGNILDGVARSVGDEKGYFLRNDDDIRDAYVRISGTFEYFLPIRDVCELIRRGEFAASH